MFIASVLIITYYNTIYCLLFYVGLAIYFSLPIPICIIIIIIYVTLAFEGISEV